MRPPPSPSLTEIVRRKRPALTFAGTRKHDRVRASFEGKAAVGENLRGTVAAELQPSLGSVADREPHRQLATAFVPVAFTLCNCGARFSVNARLTEVTGPMYSEHVAALPHAPFHCVKRHPSGRTWHAAPLALPNT